MAVLTMSFRAILAVSAVAVAAGAQASAKMRGAVVHQSSDLEKSLTEILAAIDAGEGDDYLTRRVLFIESSMASSFQALPKNEFGRLAPRSVHYIVHNYFAKEHGWQIRGFESRHFTSNSVENQTVAVLEDHLPAALEGLLEARRSHRGLALGDVVAMAALLERLIAEQSVRLLESAYEWHNFSTTDILEKHQVEQVLGSAVMLLRNPEEAAEVVETVHPEVDEPVAEFQKDTLNNVHFEQRDRTNPFTDRQYSFQEASAVIARLTHQYGKWSNSECTAMKEELKALAPKNSGLVPLSRFYKHDMTNNFRFWESVPYLRQIGALEESNPRSPQVRIANYITGPTNCIGRSSYYSVCCVDECKSIMSDLEGAVRAPSAPPARLLRLVESLGAAGDAELSDDLKDKLQAIAAHHGGMVPLHGRLFAQWLHLAFPSECSYPHIPEDPTAASADALLAGDYITTAEDMEVHLKAGEKLDHVRETPEASAWTDDEVLPLLERPASGSESWLRTGMLVVLLLAVLRAAGNMLQGAMSTFRGANSKGSLPMYA